MMEAIIREKIDELINLYTEKSGIINAAGARDKLADWGRTNPNLAIDWQVWATDRMEEYKRGKLPKPQDTVEKQTIFGFAFDLDGIVPISEKHFEWVKYKNMVPKFIIARIGLVSKKAKECADAAHVEIAFWTDVMTTMQTNHYKTLGDLVAGEGSE
jgi:hypothetical protein